MSEIDEYIKKYPTFKKKIVYKFQKGNGGIGDMFIFFIYLLQFCIKHEIQLYYLVFNNPVQDFIKLKYDIMYIHNLPQEPGFKIIYNNEQLENIKDENIYHIIEPEVLYHVSNIRDVIYLKLNDIFYFTDDVIKAANNFINLNNINQPYISIHLRLGDNYLETDPIFNMCIHDKREYDENKLFETIESNKDKTIIFFCENKEFKNKIKKKYEYIKITDLDICHTGLLNSKIVQVFNTVIEFYLLSNSEHIYQITTSGFSFIASKYKNIELTKLW